MGSSRSCQPTPYPQSIHPHPIFWWQRIIFASAPASAVSNFPRYSKKEKKPFPIPIVELRRTAQDRLKNSKGQKRRGSPPPKRGLVVQRLIPVSYKVGYEIHVGTVGHSFKFRGSGTSIPEGLHEWRDAAVEDVLVPVEAYHLYDHLGKRIRHERFSIPRIPAVVELCIQAGVELPEYPTKRRRKPTICIGKSELIDADESELPDPNHMPVLVFPSSTNQQ